MLSLLVVGLALGITAFDARAQTPASPLELRISKINGFSLGGRIQGSFRLTASGSESIQQVSFLLDGALIQEVTSPPFRMTFNTRSYSLGRHVLSASALTDTGNRLDSDPLTVEFVSPDAALTSTFQIIAPVLAIVLAVIVLAAITPLIGSRRQGQLGTYGLAGGAICPRCGSPFSRHIFSPNFLGQRLERCPECGKWSLVGRATPGQLAEAEARMRGEMAQASPPEDDDALRRTIDDSRFEP
jgi:hypothetical protein